MSAEKIAALKAQLGQSIDPREKVDVLNKLGQIIRQVDRHAAVQYAEEAFELATQINYLSGLGLSKINLSFHQYYICSNPVKAFQLAREAQEIFEITGEPGGKGWASTVMGTMYWYMGEYNTGFGLLQNGLELMRSVGEQEGTAFTTYLLGGFYAEMKDYPNALFYHEEALGIFRSLANEAGEATCIGGIGNIYHALEEYDKALHYHQRSYELAVKVENPATQARALNDMGMVYESLGKDDQAIDHLERSLVIREQIINYQGMVTCYLNLGKVFLKQKDFNTAIYYLDKAIDKASTINAKPKLLKAHQMMAQVYKEQNDLWRALQHYEKYMEVKAQVMGEESNAQLKNAQAVFNVERAQQEAEIHKLKNVELKKAYDQIEAQTRSIIDSIKYAKRIQEAILDPVEVIEKQLDEAFILYIPRDIVSGDFYWYAELADKNTGNRCKVVVAADCTGHGVPGAFMTVMGNDFLNEIVISHGVTDPAQMLYRLDEKVVATLQKQSREGKPHDGMDISILVIDEQQRRVTFSAAKNPLYLVRTDCGGQKELTEIRGSKFPIGSSQFKVSKNFETHTIDIQPGDMLYIFSDGFQDQFGEISDQKYMKKRFREFLFRISHLPAAEQKSVLEEEFLSWKGKFHQTDDVLVMGIRF